MDDVIRDPADPPCDCRVQSSCYKIGDKAEQTEKKAVEARQQTVKHMSCLKLICKINHQYKRRPDIKIHQRPDVYPFQQAFYYNEPCCHKKCFLSEEDRIYDKKKGDELDIGKKVQCQL